MSFESFYGGRQGASFIIVHHFDGINIPEGTCKTKFYAIDSIENENPIYKFIINSSTGAKELIEKNQDTQDHYTWYLTELNGEAVTLTDGTQLTRSREEAEGMVQCFKQGGKTTDIVNYGEYVIIDTVFGFSDTSDVDNGKVFRRGMNYDYSDSNPLAGAEYIGQIVGPKGETASLGMDTVSTIIDAGGATGTYGGEDLVPGKDGDTYNDSIQYAWVNVRNQAGDIEKALIGFKFPYLVEEFTAKVRSPYQNGVPIDSNVQLATKIDDGNHPFYGKWEIEVPKGIHGIDSGNFDIVHTKTKPAGYGEDSYAGTAVWEDEACTIPLMEEGSQVVLTAAAIILRETPNHNYTPSERQSNFPIYNQSTVSCKIMYNGIIRYVKKVDCYIDQVRYKEISYDDYEAGTFTFIDVDIKFVENIEIQTEDNTGIEGSGNQRVYITYNTDVSAPVEVGKPLNYVVDTYVVPQSDRNGIQGHLLVYYSDPVRRNASSIKDLIYPSARLGQNINGWTDLGDVKGSSEPHLAFTEKSSWAEVQALGAPEDEMHNDKYAGWGVIYPKGNIRWVAQYDYVAQEWKDGVPYDIGMTDPIQVINYDSANLYPNGFRIDTENRTVANEILTKGVIYQVAQKDNNSNFSPVPIGPEVRYVSAQQNSHTRNLEEQLMIGTDTLTRKKYSIINNDTLKIIEDIDYFADQNKKRYNLVKEYSMDIPVKFESNKLTLNLNSNITDKVERLNYIPDVHNRENVIDLLYKNLVYEEELDGTLYFREYISDTPPSVQHPNIPPSAQ